MITSPLQYKTPLSVLECTHFWIKIVVAHCAQPTVKVLETSHPVFKWSSWFDRKLRCYDKPAWNHFFTAWKLDISSVISKKFQCSAVHQLQKQSTSFNLIKKFHDFLLLNKNRKNVATHLQTPFWRKWQNGIISWIHIDNMSEKNFYFDVIKS